VFEADKVRVWDEDALSYRATGQQCARFMFDETIAPGDMLAMGELSWQALSAPGHDPHALLFWCAGEGILIAGDALWQNGFGVIFPELAGEPGFGEVKATLDLIASLEPRLVIPGHGAPFTDVDAALQRAYGRLDYLSFDPARNAENGVKVLLKFLLIERRTMPLAEVAALFETVPLLVLARERFLPHPAAELAQWAVRALEKAGAAQLRDGILVDIA
jgi:glyoxylase-like metal-dependent hydrolase (beta-lactamase superfamily II)